MHNAEVFANPFALMMNPEAVIAAMNHSDRLTRLKSRICRPLDKPMSLQTLADASDDSSDDHAARQD